MIKNRTPDITELKELAKALRADFAARGILISHSQALEKIARHFGYRDWNTCSAALRNTPQGSQDDTRQFAVGDRVAGTYLGCPFTGTVRSASSETSPALQRVRVHFDDTVNVSRFDRFDVFRRNVSASIIIRTGRSPASISTGEPQMVLRHLS